MKIDRPARTFLLFSFSALVLTFLFTFPNVSRLKNEYPLPRDLEKDEALTLSLEKPAHWVPLKAVSPYLRKAILISEDDAFYDHEGIDWKQLRMAMEEGLEEGGRLRGASTITQQLAKNLYLSSQKSLLRKLREALIATRIEKEISKDRILEIYLNVIEFGSGIYGIGKAARFYFLKSASNLSPKEAAFLAMLLPNPKKYSVSFRKGALTPYASSSIRRILGRMRQVQWLSEDLYQSSISTPLTFEKAAIEARAEDALRAMGQLHESQDSTEKPLQNSGEPSGEKSGENSAEKLSETTAAETDPAAEVSEILVDMNVSTEKSPENNGENSAPETAEPVAETPSREPTGP
jgi:monofunctional glycosyltransferase